VRARLPAPPEPVQAQAVAAALAPHRELAVVPA